MSENNMPIISKRLCNMVRIIYYMLRKGISKSNKLHAAIDLLLRRGKNAWKAIIHSLVLPHLTSSSSPISHRQSRSHRISPFSNEYEFSCSNSPSYNFQNFHSKRNKTSSLFLGCIHAPKTNEEEEREATIDAVKMVIEMLNNHNDEKLERVTTTMVQVQPFPALSGFGRSPAVPVRQLRVTDSPFPLHDVGGDFLVDEKAEQFIAKFYNDLKRQRVVHASPSPGRH